jgi:hypothetical protein
MYATPLHRLFAPKWFQDHSCLFIRFFPSSGVLVFCGDLLQAFFCGLCIEVHAKRSFGSIMNEAETTHAEPTSGAFAVFR